MRSLVFVLALAACGADREASVAYDRSAEVTKLVRMMERDPALADELFSQVRMHPTVLARLDANIARANSDQDFARGLATELVKHPEATKMLVAETIAAAESDRAAQEAIVAGFEVHATLFASYLRGFPEELATLATALFDQARNHPDAATRKQMAVFIELVNQKRRAVRMGS